MGKRKSAQRRNKKFKAADPFARGKSQANLGQVKSQVSFLILRGAFNCKKKFLM